MKFLVAQKELSKIAKGKYQSIIYTVTTFGENGGGGGEVKCTVYVDGYKHCHGETWAEALNKMKAAVKGTHNKPNLEAPE